MQSSRVCVCVWGPGSVCVCAFVCLSDEGHVNYLSTDVSCQCQTETFHSSNKAAQPDVPLCVAHTCNTAQPHRVTSSIIMTLTIRNYFVSSCCLENITSSLRRAYYSPVRPQRLFFSTKTYTCDLCCQMDYYIQGRLRHSDPDKDEWTQIWTHPLSNGFSWLMSNLT